MLTMLAMLTMFKILMVGKHPKPLILRKVVKVVKVVKVAMGVKVAIFPYLPMVMSGYRRGLTKG